MAEMDTALSALDEAWKGGPGSGNFRHAGRPGLVGGSAAGGSGKPAGESEMPSSGATPDARHAALTQQASDLWRKQQNIRLDKDILSADERALRRIPYMSDRAAERKWKQVSIDRQRAAVEKQEREIEALHMPKLSAAHVKRIGEAVVKEFGMAATLGRRYDGLLSISRHSGSIVRQSDPDFAGRLKKLFPIAIIAGDDSSASLGARSYGMLHKTIFYVPED